MGSLQPFFGDVKGQESNDPGYPRSPDPESSVEDPRVVKARGRAGWLVSWRCAHPFLLPTWPEEQGSERGGQGRVSVPEGWPEATLDGRARFPTIFGLGGGREVEGDAIVPQYQGAVLRGRGPVIYSEAGAPWCACGLAAQSDARPSVRRP